MPKFKLGNIVARVVLGESWRERNNTDYLYAEFGRYRSESYPPAHSRTALDDGDYDDAISIISTSSTATFDDLPGTGRTLDMYIFQPMGRRIERLAMRFTIASLHPAHIAQYIGSSVSVLFSDWMTLHDAIDDLCSYDRRNGSTVVAGMKGLVKQTQSNSIDRSATALAALIRVSFGFKRKEVYANISRIEPIFHLETLVRSHPDKKWFLFLVKLGRETLIAIRTPSSQTYFDPFLKKNSFQLWPSQETAQNLRQRLIRVLKAYRLSGLVSLDDTIGEACAICAEAASTCISTHARGDAYMHILDTVYFTVIFILRSVYELADLARTTNSKHICMVLRTLACWMDDIVCRCINSAQKCRRRYDMDLLKVAIAFRSVVLVDVDTKYLLLPGSFKSIWHGLLSELVIPRRDRERNKDIYHIESLIEAAKQRTRRLVRSFDALEIEVRGCTSQSSHCTTQLNIIADPYWSWTFDFGEEWWKCWKITLERARRARVPANSLTEEFSEARRIGLKDEYKHMNWAEYQLHRMSQNKWGQYLRSNMIWDWDLGTCMERLFEVVEQTSFPHTQSPSASSSLIDVAAGPEGTLKISMGEAQGSLPKEVQISYKTENGEIQYLTFTHPSPSPGNHPFPETAGAGSPPEEFLDPTVAQRVSGHGKGSFGGKQEFENPETSAFDPDVSKPSACDDNPDVSKPSACDDNPIEASSDDCEGKEPEYGVGYDEFRAGEDMISICSLD